jgi:toxin ParE1/3/4
MSARRVVSFAPQARQDLDDILLYSARTWGRDQVERYSAAINRVVDRTRQFPETGRDCETVLPGGRSVRCEHHRIYYTYDDHAVIVHRILHERRQVTPGMLSPDPDE